MLYAMLADWKPGLSREQQQGALGRKAQWQYPAGVKVVGEYWLGTHAPVVIAAFEADAYDPILEIALTWQDVFDLHFYPATTAEAGLQMGQQVMQRLSAGQGGG